MNYESINSTSKKRIVSHLNCLTCIMNTSSGNLDTFI